MDKMKRVNAILRHPLYRRCYGRLEELEKDRIFCCHQMPHLLDVARIAYILNMEQDLGLEKDMRTEHPTNSRERRLPPRYWIRFPMGRRFQRRKNA